MARATVEERASPPGERTGEGDRLLTPEEVAARLRVTRRTVYAWLKIGRMRGLRAGKGWRIRPADLDAFLLPPAAWEARLDASLALVRSQVPTDIPEEDIEADLKSAREAVHQERRARGS
jgi:excisionase family DNA binding protein